MPIEIRELVIRARVDPGGERRTGSTAAPAARDSQQREEVVQTCVKEVLRILEDRHER